MCDLEKTGRTRRCCRGKPFPPISSTAPALSTYPSPDVRHGRAKTTTVGQVIDHKVHGDSHDSTGFHDQGMGVGLDKAVGADSGL